MISRSLTKYSKAGTFNLLGMTKDRKSGREVTDTQTLVLWLWVRTVSGDSSPALLVKAVVFLVCDSPISNQQFPFTDSIST